MLKRLKYLLVYALLVVSSISFAEKKVALVIGNSKYYDNTCFPSLSTPENDAIEIGGKLSSLGFDTIMVLNANKKQMIDAIKRFDRASRNADVGVFFYSGHGTNIKSVNYLVPCETSFYEATLSDECIYLGNITEMMGRNCNLSLSFLDACRDDSKAGGPNKSIVSPSGFSTKKDIDSSAPAGWQILYATENGKTATTGNGKLSPFTASLSKYLMDEREFREVVEDIQIDVYNSCGQVPQPVGNYKNDFYFNKPQRKITFNVSPNHAKLFFGDKVYAIGQPLTFDKGKSYTYHIEADGYQDENATFIVDNATPSAFQISLKKLVEKNNELNNVEYESASRDTLTPQSLLYIKSYDKLHVEANALSEYVSLQWTELDYFGKFNYLIEQLGDADLIKRILSMYSDEEERKAAMYVACQEFNIENPNNFHLYTIHIDKISSAAYGSSSPVINVVNGHNDIVRLIVVDLPKHGIVIESGKCGDNVSYELYEDGTLILSGTGEMINYGLNKSPFAYNKFINTVIIESGIVNVGNAAFHYCSNLRNVSLPNTVEVIGYCSFSNCGLCSIHLPNSVREIEGSSFNNNPIDSLIIPNSVTCIRSNAFGLCQNLKYVFISSSVSEIGQATFSNCSDIEALDVDIHNKTYDSRNHCNAIVDKRNQTLITGCYRTKIPNSVKCISSYAFYGCSKLDSLDIPSSVVEIQDKAFEGCDNISYIHVATDNKIFDGGYNWNNYNAIVDRNSHMLIMGCKNTKIPNSVTSIGPHAFHGRRGLRYIKIPDSVISIGEDAFCMCWDLDSIVFSNSLLEIGEGAFWGCDLKEIVLPNNLVSIGENAFRSNRDLETVFIPKSIAKIGKNVFRDCLKLKSINISYSKKHLLKYSGVNASCEIRH